MTDRSLCCTLNQPPEIARRGSLLKTLYESTLERREMEHGFAFRFNGDAATERKVFEFIAMERDCCRFLSFQLNLAPERGSIWLAVEGPDGVKEFARAEMGRFGLHGIAAS